MKRLSYVNEFASTGVWSEASRCTIDRVAEAPHSRLRHHTMLRIRHRALVRRVFQRMKARAARGEA